MVAGYYGTESFFSDLCFSLSSPEAFFKRGNQLDQWPDRNIVPCCVWPSTPALSFFHLLLTCACLVHRGDGWMAMAMHTACCYRHSNTLSTSFACNRCLPLWCSEYTQDILPQNASFVKWYVLKSALESCPLIFQAESQFSFFEQPNVLYSALPFS